MAPATRHWRNSPTTFVGPLTRYVGELTPWKNPLIVQPCPSQLLFVGVRPRLSSVKSNLDKAAIKSLPSHAEFQSFFDFANDFYQLVAGSINGVGPAMIPRAVGHGFIRLMESLGAQGARFDFDADD